jgi:NhaP-type Na+/H+ and K+/H+ antiporter
LEDILPIDPDGLCLIANLHMMKEQKDTDVQRQNMKLLLSMLMDNDIDITETILENDDTFFNYYQKNPSPELTNLFIRNVTFFSPYVLKKYDMFKVIVQHLDRNDFYAKVKSMDADEKYEELYMKEYDTTAKKRAVDVSLGLGYAQMDNQVQSTIPTLVLQQIVDESADLSGMPAWQVYQIVKHINEGTTDKTIRLGVENKFADVKEEAIKIGRLGLPDDFQDAEE